MYAGIYARVPAEFSTHVTELPADFYTYLGLVMSGSARLELFLGLLVNNIGASFTGPETAGRWPFKADERIRWLTNAFAMPALTSLHSSASVILSQVRLANDVRNEIAHSAILAYGPDLHVYVARVKTDRNGNQLELQEGVSYNFKDLQQAALALEQCNHLLLGLVTDIRELSQMRARP